MGLDNPMALAVRQRKVAEAVIALADSASTEEVVTHFGRDVRDLFDVTRCTLALVAADGSSYRLRTLVQRRSEALSLDVPAVPIGDGLAGVAKDSGHAVHVTDVNAYRGSLPVAVDAGLWTGELRTVLALPLQAHGTVLGTLVLGVLWGLWHLPLYVYTPNYNGAGAGFAGITPMFLAFIVCTTALAIVFTWLYNSTGASVVFLAFAHASFNAGTMWAPAARSYDLILFAVAAVLGVAVLVGTRGRLGWKPEAAPAVVVPAAST